MNLKEYIDKLILDVGVITEIFVKFSKFFFKFLLVLKKNYTFGFMIFHK